MSIETARAVNRDPSRSIRIRGTEAEVELDGDGDLEINAASQAGIDHYVDTTLSGDMEHTGYAGPQVVFFEDLRSGEQPDTCTFEEGIRTQRIMDAVYESNARGTAVRLD